MNAGGVREGAGRKSGSLGKNAVILKEMVTEALTKAGGIDYLVTQANENPVAFLALIGKLIPREIKSDVDMSVDPATMLADLKARAIAVNKRLAKENTLNDAESD